MPETKKAARYPFSRLDIPLPRSTTEDLYEYHRKLGVKYPDMKLICQLLYLGIIEDERILKEGLKTSPK